METYSGIEDPVDEKKEKQGTSSEGKALTISNERKKKLATCTIATLLHSPVEKDVPLIAEDIQKVIDDHSHQISDWAWIIHDKDVFSADDMSRYYDRKKKSVDKGDPLYGYYQSIREGLQKPSHVHIALRFGEGKSQYDTDVARWFNTDIKNIRNGYKRINTDTAYGNRIYHCLKYFLHYGTEDKYIYEKEDLHVSDSLKPKLQDIREDGKKGGDLTRVLNEMKAGKTLLEVRRDEPYEFYLSRLSILKAAEEDYRLHEMEIPKHLINVYISGKSGSGKTTLAKWIARALYPDSMAPYFNVGTDGVSLQNYAGEPVIIYGDTMPSKIKGIAREGDLFELLEPHNREKVARNIKFSSTILFNAVNIFTTTMDYKKFFDDLVYETPVEQIYRRMQIIIEIGENGIDVKVNEKEIEDRDDVSFNREYDYDTDGTPIPIPVPIEKTSVKRYETVYHCKCDIGYLFRCFSTDIAESMMKRIVEPIAIIIRSLYQYYEESHNDPDEIIPELVAMKSIEMEVSGGYNIWGGKLDDCKKVFEAEKDGLEKAEEEYLEEMRIGEEIGYMTEEEADEATIKEYQEMKEGEELIKQMNFEHNFWPNWGV